MVKLWLRWIIHIILLLQFGNFLSISGEVLIDNRNAVQTAEDMLIKGQYQGIVDVLNPFVKLNPSHIRGNNLLGISYLVLGDAERASGYLLSAFQLSSNADYDSLSNYISSLAMLDRFPELMSYCDNLLTLPIAENTKNVFKNCGSILRNYERFDLAAEFYKQVVRMEHDVAHWTTLISCMFRAKASDAEIYQVLSAFVEEFPGRGDAHIAFAEHTITRKLYPQAMSLYQEALRLEPSNYKARSGLASLYLQEGNQHEAMVLYESLLPFHPDDFGTRNNYGMLLNLRNRGDEAKVFFEECLRINPNFRMAVDNLVVLYVKDGMPIQAAQYLRQLQPESPTPLLIDYQIALLIPTVSESWDEMIYWRQHAWTSLNNLMQSWLATPPRRELIDNSFEPRCFYFTYHGLNDRPLLEQAVAGYELSIADVHDPVPLAPPPDLLGLRSRKQRQINIGFISSFFYIAEPHGLLLDGPMKHLPRDIFRVFVLVVVNNSTIPLAPTVFEAADEVRQVSKDILLAKSTIAALDLDILVFADTWGEHHTHFLAQTRFAPIQAAFWGNPMTSASPNVDYFLSADGMEYPFRTRMTPESEVYTEQVVLLEGQGIWYYQPEPFEITLKRAGLSSANVEPFDPFNRSMFNIPEDAFLFLCPQSVFKMHPLFDAVLARIVQGGEHIYLAVTGGRRKHWTGVYTERIARAVGGRNSSAWSRVRILSRVTSDQILSLMQIADMILHPFPFDGSRTSADALAIGSPFLTLPSEHLRGRMGYRYFQTMDIPDLVTHNISEYISRALRFAYDRNYYNEIKALIAERTWLIWEDMEYSHSFTSFFCRVVGEKPPSWDAFITAAGRNVTTETHLREIRSANRASFDNAWGSERYMLDSDGVGRLPSSIPVGEILPIFNDWKKAPAAGTKGLDSLNPVASGGSQCSSFSTALNLLPVEHGGGLLLAFSLIIWAEHRQTLFNQIAARLINQGKLIGVDSNSFSLFEETRRLQRRPELLLQALKCYEPLMVAEGSWGPAMQLVAGIAVASAPTTTTGAGSDASIAAIKEVTRSFAAMLTQWEAQSHSDLRTREAYSEYGITLMFQLTTYLSSPYDSVAAGVLQRNLNNPALGQIILFHRNEQVNFAAFNNSWKIVPVMLAKTLSYEHAIDYANKELVGRTVVVAPTNIVFDDTLFQLHAFPRRMTDNDRSLLVALTPWMSDGDAFGIHLAERRLAAVVFKSPFQLPKHPQQQQSQKEQNPLDVCVNCEFCGNKIVNYFHNKKQQDKYLVVNMAFTVRAIEHQTGLVIQDSRCTENDVVSNDLLISDSFVL